MNVSAIRTALAAAARHESDALSCWEDARDSLDAANAAGDTGRALYFGQLSESYWSEYKFYKGEVQGLRIALMHLGQLGQLGQ